MSIPRRQASDLRATVRGRTDYPFGRAQDHPADNQADVPNGGSTCAKGAGRIMHHEGLDHLLAEYAEHVVAVDLLPPGAPRRDWRATSLSDGVVVVRHRELPKTMEMADRFAAELHLYAD